MSKLWKSDNHTRIPHNVSTQETKCYNCPHSMTMAFQNSIQVQQDFTFILK